MGTPTSSHAYGIGVIALIIGMSAFVVFYTSFYLPESMAKPSVADHILHPEEEFLSLKLFQVQLLREMIIMFQMTPRYY